MLGCIDRSGNVFIYVVKDNPSTQTLKVFPIFQIYAVCIQFLLSI